MRIVKFIFAFVIIGSCSKSNDDELLVNSLANYIENRQIETGAVIACAASEQITNAVLVFYYPEDGATNIQFFETKTTAVNNDDYSNYTKVDLESAPFFNGYLGKFTRLIEEEQWIIVTFELEGEVKISNPIRSKQLTKPTVWNDAVTIERTLMPVFNWEANAFGDNAIYFQVLSNDQNDLLSGTYTTENQFQYYNLSNVVLNITTQMPPALQNNTLYNFTLMDVSEDNWVNLVSQKAFTIQ